MKILLAICAFSALPCLVICQPPHPEVLPIAGKFSYTDSPFWHNNQLFFVDPLGPNLCAYHLDHGNTICAFLGRGYTAFAAPVRNSPDKFVISLDEKLFIVTWNSHVHEIDPLMERVMHQGQHVLESDIRQDRINYGTVNPYGTLWFGTMKQGRPAFGEVWSYSSLHPPYLRTHLDKPGLRLHVMNGNNLCNGIVWYREYGINRFYFNDARRNRIELYYYDIDTRDVAGQVDIIFDLTDHYGPHIPQHSRIGRFTIDFRGWLWLPIIGGSGILEFDPHNKQPHRFIEIPSSEGVSACAFGGDEMRTLYATTVGPPPDHPRAEHDDSGGVFSVKNLGEGVQGFYVDEFVWTDKQTSYTPHRSRRTRRT